MKWLFTILSRLLGRNTALTPPSVITAQLLEPRALPMGVQEFHEWSDRIISGAMIPGATARDQKFALAGMVMHAKPTESFMPDGYFIQSLRKVAANQVCHAMIMQYKADQAKEAAEAEARQRNPGLDLRPGETIAN